MWNQTSITKILGVQYPIIQGAFGGNFSSTELTSLVSNLGGIGSFGMNSYSPEEILEIDQEIKTLTNKPYILNLWVPKMENSPLELNQGNYDSWIRRYRPYFENLEADLPHYPEEKENRFEVQFAAILKAKPPIVSFIFGIPEAEKIESLKANEIKIIIAASNLKEALAIQDAGADAVILSGSQAGGHRPSFIPDDGKMLTTEEFFVSVKKHMKIPMIVAGGISNHVDASRFLKAGADAVQIGTAFLATKESNANQAHKDKLLQADIKTVLTTIFTGRLGRAIVPNSPFLLEEKPIIKFPFQSNLLSNLRKKATEKNAEEYIAYWSGQPSSTLEHKSTLSLFNSLVTGIDGLYEFV